MNGNPIVTGFFDPDTSSVSYVVRDPGSTACAIFDAVLDFDYASGRIGHIQAEKIAAFVTENHLSVDWLIETHVHADHLSAAPYLQARLGGQLGISREITVVQARFGKIFDAGVEFASDGRQFDRLFGDEDSYWIGGMAATVLHTPGHTPVCTTHVIGDAALVGDTLFMPDGGTARTDLAGGDARVLYRSIRRVLALPLQTRLFMCHDYGAEGRAIQWETTVAAERSHNIHVRDGIDEDTFVLLRTARDATLSMPRLILPAIQINMRGKELPPAASDGRRYLKIPIEGF